MYSRWRADSIVDCNMRSILYRSDIMKLSEAKKELKELKTEYGKAVKANLDKFAYNGEFMLTSYAKYMIEYLENEIERLDDKPWHN